MYVKITAEVDRNFVKALGENDFIRLNAGLITSWKSAVAKDFGIHTGDIDASMFEVYAFGGQLMTITVQRILSVVGDEDFADSHAKLAEVLEKETAGILQPHMPERRNSTVMVIIDPLLIAHVHKLDVRSWSAEGVRVN